VKNNLRFLTILILQFYIFCIGSFAASPLRIDVIKKSSSIIILFEGKKNDFAFSKSGKNLTLRFDREVIFGDTSKINKHDQFVKTVDIQSGRLNLVLQSDQLKAHKFEIAGKSGIEIATPDFIPKKIDKEEEASASENSVFLSEDVDKSVVIFKFSQDSGASSYIRGARLWVVFDKDLNVGELNFKSTRFQNFKREKSVDGTSIFSMKLTTDSDTKPTLIMYKEGNDWHLKISNQAIKAKYIRVVSRPLAAPHPRVDVELDENPSDPIKFKDPYIGDELIALPFKESAVAITNNFTFVDFKVLESVQGGVIQPISDAIQIKKQDWSYQIISTGGLNIAPRLYNKREVKFEERNFGFKLDEYVQDFQSILSLKSYEVEDNQFLNKVQSLRSELMKANTLEKRARIYANWALFYLANGFYKEGLQIIELLKKDDPEFGNSYNIKIIESAMNYMNNDYFKSYSIAREISMLDVPISLRKEVRFWQAISSYMVSNAESYLTRLDPMTLYVEHESNFLSEYTKDIIFEFGIAIATHKIEDRQLSEAKTIVNDLLKSELKPHDMNKVYNIAARLNAIMNYPDEAIGYWEKCTSDVEDLLYRSICRFELANYKNETQRLSDYDYVEELERIALIWRGDELEIDLLGRLGDKYLELDEYSKALKSWDTIVKFFPYSPESLRLGRKMGDTFVRFFLDTKAEDVSDLEALTLFYEFEHLVPVGDIGDKIVSRFIEHLVSLDLLDRAALMLQHQVDKRLHGNEREVAINKLVEIYLHNLMPIKALLAIESGDEYGELPDDIAFKRKYLHARALHYNKQDAKALKLLKGDLSPEADEMNSMIYWDEQNWDEFNKFAEPRIYQIREQEGELETEDSEKVLKLAISYLMTSKYDLLDALIRDFRKRMPENERNTLILTTITKSWESIKVKKLETSRALSLIKETVDQILDVMKTKEEVGK